MIREYGTSSRTFKSSLIFCVPESPDTLREDARKVLAWEAIDDDDLKLDETQVHQLARESQKSPARLEGNHLAHLQESDAARQGQHREAR